MEALQVLETIDDVLEYIESDPSLLSRGSYYVHFITKKMRHQPPLSIKHIYGVGSRLQTACDPYHDKLNSSNTFHPLEPPGTLIECVQP